MENNHYLTMILRKSNEHKFGYAKGFSIENKGTRYPLSVITIPTAPKAGQHPTQKPVALMEYLIKTYTNEGEIVLDFTLGSGTTIVACNNTNRIGIGFENNQEYGDVIRKRLGLENECAFEF